MTPSNLLWAVMSAQNAVIIWLICERNTGNTLPLWTTFVVAAPLGFLTGWFWDRIYPDWLTQRLNHDWRDWKASAIAQLDEALDEETYLK